MSDSDYNCILCLGMYGFLLVIPKAEGSIPSAKWNAFGFKF